jgi:asparagine synthase (glutamine-hydrolysing)
LRLISDVPLGIFLSGGVDSTALLALGQQLTGGELRTITVGFDVNGFDESASAAATASAFGTRHQTVRLTGQDVLHAMPAVLEAMDQPTVDGTNIYFVSRAARESGLTVALSGLGGDELFGGYATFKDVPRAVRLRRRWAWASKPMRLVPLRRYRSGAKLLEVLERPADPLSMYLLRRELFLPRERRRLQPLPAPSDARTGIPQVLAEELSERSRQLEDTHQVSFFELELYMRHMLLRDADTFSMAAPIEYRVPFLDHELVETAFALPSAWKLPDPRPKPLLLDAVGSQIPAWVWQKPKAGFTFPWRAWFNPGRPLAGMAREAAQDQETWRRLGLHPAGASDTWRRFAARDRSVSPLQVLALVVLRDFASRYRLRAA